MSSPVSVNILGTEYQISCPEGETEALISSAKLLNDNMEQIRSTGKVVGLDRLAVMAALNIAHDLINFENTEGSGLASVNKSILLMKDKVSAFLEEDRQLEL
jgi:cell division protein ZapA